MVPLVEAMIPAPAVGLALSGGGSRAIAFGLGCLRALHDQDVLRHVRVVSGISGGSLLAAMWAYGPAEFAEFDALVTAFLRRGLQRDLVRAALTPSALARNALSSLRATPLIPGRRHRTVTRTDLLAQLLRSRLFGTRELPDVTLPNVTTVISATDLLSTNAVRFGSKTSSCSPYGLITNRIPVADAIAASAAHPVLLPALTRTYKFQDSNGICQEHSLAMTDGGIYDNLGLSPLLPGRSSAHTSHVYPLNYLIAVDAGRGRARKRGLSFLPARLNRSMDITYSRAQDGTRTQLNQAELGASPRIHPCLSRNAGSTSTHPARRPHSPRTRRELPNQLRVNGKDRNRRNSNARRAANPHPGPPLLLSTLLLTAQTDPLQQLPHPLPAACHPG
jgi:NTE family protein